MSTRNRPPTKKSTETAARMAQRRDQVAELYIKTNLTMRQLGEKLGVTAATICSDLMACKEEWARRYAGNIEEKKKVELARIDALELEAWKAWERSAGLHTKTTTKESPAAGKQEAGPYAEPATTKEKTIHKEKLNGDPRYLDQVQKCIEQRRKLLGLDEPTRQTISDPEGGPVAFRLEGLEGAAWIPQQLKRKPTSE